MIYCIYEIVRESRFNMAVKQHYKLPFTLDTGPLDIEINLSAQNSNMSFSKRPVTVKFFIMAAIAGCAWFMLTFNSPLSHGSFLSLTIWSLAYFGVVGMMLAPTKTKDMGYNWFMPSIQYLFKVNRHVGTRGNDATGPVHMLLDLKQVKNDGLLVFNNGDVGQILNIVGFGSILMFDSDRDMVLSDTNKFYRNLPAGSVIIFDTRQSPQKVETQIANLKEQARNREIKSKALKNLQKNELLTLRQYVGRQFKSTHQVMIVRTPDVEHMQAFNSHLSTVAGGSFIRSAEIMEQEDVIEYMKDLKGS